MCFLLFKFIFLLCEVRMTRKKDLQKPKPPPKITKTQGSVILGRSTFIEKIIKKGEPQASVGPRKGPTQIP
jgi:hypothetical protein